MRYEKILSNLSLAVLASASMTKRNAAPYKEVIDSIDSNVTSLAMVVNAYSGGDEKPVVDASDALVKSLNDGRAKIDSLDEISVAEALSISESLQKLNTDSQNLTDELKKKRDVVEQAGQCDKVRAVIDNINESAGQLVDSAVKKSPKSEQSLAQSFVAEFTKSFNETKDYFSTSNCKNGGGKEPTATTTPKSTSPISASSTTDTTAATDTATHRASSGFFRPSPPSAWVLGIMSLFYIY